MHPYYHYLTLVFYFSVLAVLAVFRPIVLWRLRRRAQLEQMVFESEHPEDYWSDLDRKEAIRCRMQALVGAYARWLI